MYYDAFGRPVTLPFGMMGSPPQASNNDDVVKMAKNIIKEHKAERKKKIEDEKKKEAKSKPKTFTFLETVGMVMVSSIPLCMLQLWLLGNVQIYLSTILNAPRP